MISRKTVLSRSEIKRITNASLSDPFSLLGKHRIEPFDEGKIEIRVYNPAAETVWIISEKDVSPFAMERINKEGLFICYLSDCDNTFKYQIRTEYPDGIITQAPDPYSFLPQLGELDLHLISEGRHEKLYEKMGARIWQVGNCTGVLFSVWAPNARQVSVTGNFNSWDRRRNPMRNRGFSGIWELFIPELKDGDLYKFVIKQQHGKVVEKADPFGNAFELRPGTSSIVKDLSVFNWNDEKWMESRKNSNPLSCPMMIYELHASSWKKPADGSLFVSWEDLGRELIPYVVEMGFTHIELLPVSEHPLDDSWGYQTTGYFAPTSRLGSPEDFMFFIDTCHQAGIGVIMDWSPAHFPEDDFALARFDGSYLFEHEDPRKGKHPDWNTLIFNYDRSEVRNFLLASALFWFDYYHIDGLRVDAVASMLYLDYSRRDGEWLPNVYGGNENLGAVSFLKELNTKLHSIFPGIVVIAEESTAWSGVTQPVHSGGLGFTLKWNMGWMNDSLRFFSRDSVHRKYHLDDLTFSLLYAFSENFVLPLSHDEVVHGKKSLLSKMPGDEWKKLANLKLLLVYQWAHPGKQLLFMGGELGQWKEWDHNKQISWELLEQPGHNGIAGIVRDLNRICRNRRAFYEQDFSPEGFEWIDCNDSEQTVISFRRIAKDGSDVLCVFNLTPTPRYEYRIGVSQSGIYSELLNSDSELYSGSNVGNKGGVKSIHEKWHSKEYSIMLTLPPLGALILARK